MNSKGMKVSLIVVLLLVAAGAGVYFFFTPTPELPKAIAIDTKDQPTMGNSNAKIHIVAFEDLKCINCMRFNTTLLPKIEKQFIKTGEAKYTMINLAFIRGSLPAANAARCIYTQNKQAFFDFVKYVYDNQPPEEQNWANIPKLLNFASHVKGINQKKLSACMVKSPYSQFINNNMKLAGKVMGDVISTPTIYVNGVLVQPLTMKRFKQVVNAVK